MIILNYRKQELNKNIIAQVQKYMGIVSVTTSIRKEANVLFNDAQHILFTVIWCQTYG